MDSINKQQPENNTEHLNSTAAAERIKVLAKAAESCFFCTSSSTGESEGVRPMSVQHADEQGVLWFLSPADSHKNQEILADPNVKLFFQGSAHAEFLYLTGTASISQDKEKIDELWQPILKTWFTEGKDDPRITVIKVVPSGGYYWDNKHGNLVAGVKMLFGSIVGKTYDDSIEGKLSPGQG